MRYLYLVTLLLLFSPTLSYASNDDLFQLRFLEAIHGTSCTLPNRRERTGRIEIVDTETRQTFYREVTVVCECRWQAPLLPTQGLWHCTRSYGRLIQDWSIRV